jgi:hypothetical protein
VALDARTGRPVPDFGTDGLVDLKLGFDRASSMGLRISTKRHSPANARSSFLPESMEAGRRRCHRTEDS